MNRSIAARVARLEARHKSAADKPKGVIGCEYGHLIVDPDKPGHLKRSEPPGGFAKFAATQQFELQADLKRLLQDQLVDQTQNEIS